MPHALARALSLAAAMSCEILWALILGFGISGAVHAVLSKAQDGPAAPDDSPRSRWIGCRLGVASLMVLAGLAVVALLATGLPARAHEGAKVGRYLLPVGFGTEPA